MPVETAQRYWPLSDFIRDYYPPNWNYVLLRFRWGADGRSIPVMSRPTTSFGNKQQKLVTTKWLV
jgi:hypothetical protein